MSDLTTEHHESSGAYDRLLSAEQSRRRFLRTAVVGTAGVAGAAGVAGIILSQHGSQPSLLTIADISGVSQGHIHSLFEDTDCGTGGDATQCGDYSSKDFTINPGGHSTSPGSFFIVMAIQGLPKDSYTVSAQEKLSTAGSYSNIPDSGSGSSSLPFEYQSSGGISGNTNVYFYPTGTIGAPPYALTAAPYNAPTATVHSSSIPSSSFPTSAPWDVLIFIHVSWHNAVALAAKNDTITIDFQVTLTGSGSNTVTETISTTGKQA